MILSAAPTLIVLAAGMGSRYGGLKQVVPVNAAGEALLDYSVFDAVRAGFGRVVFVLRRDIEQVFRSTVGQNIERHVRVAYAFQELDELPPGFEVPHGRVKPWGTLHATLTGATVTSGPFAVINADDFYGAESYRALAVHLRSNSTSCAMVGYTLRNTLSDFGPVSRSICRVNDGGLLLSTVERTRLVRDGAGARSLDTDGAVFSGNEIASMNMWGFTPAVVEPLRQLFRDFLEARGTDLTAESYLPNAVNSAIAGGLAQVAVLRTHDAWFGMTYPEEQPFVEQSIRDLTLQGLYPEKLWP